MLASPRRVRVCKWRTPSRKPRLSAGDSFNLCLREPRLGGNTSRSLLKMHPLNCPVVRAQTSYVQRLVRARPEMLALVKGMPDGRSGRPKLRELVNRLAPPRRAFDWVRRTAVTFGNRSCLRQIPSLFVYISEYVELFVVGSVSSLCQLISAGVPVCRATAMV